MAQLTLRQLEHFVAVAETGGVTAGAQNMHVTQSAMSSALSELERSLGTALLQRHRRGVSLTPAGHAILAEARRLLSGVDDLHTTANEINGAIHGTLVVGCYSTLAPALMPTAIATFLAAHPDVDLSFVEGSNEELVGGLRDGRLELAIMYDFGLGQLPDSKMMSRTVLQATAPKALVPESHPLSQSTLSLEILTAEPLILFDLAPAGEYFRGMFEERGLHPHIRFRTRSHQLVGGLVAQGLGCSVVSQISDTPPGVAVKDLTDNLPPLPILALSGASVSQTKRALAFVEHCRSALK